MDAVGGQPAPGDGDDVAEHRLEGALGVDVLQRAVGLVVPVGDQPGVQVVLGGEVAVDGALGVLGAVGDLLDGDGLPVVAVHERDGGVEQRALALLQFAGLAVCGADGRPSTGDLRSPRGCRHGVNGG